MSNEPPPSRPSLADLDARLQKARQAERGASRRRTDDGEARSGAIGIAFRLSVELVSAVVVGGGIGWLLDHWLGTAPWCLLGFFLLGIVAGMVNVFRAARDLNARAARLAQDLPPAPADEDDD
jgi:ATP synthase protein I